MEREEPRWDDHLEERYEEAQAGGGEREETEEETDPELEAWLRAREADLAEQAFALADQFDKEW
jgi:hypothetical protein